LRQKRHRLLKMQRRQKERQRLPMRRPRQRKRHHLMKRKKSTKQPHNSDGSRSGNCNNKGRGCIGGGSGRIEG
jgi:hypothetical protein